MEHKLGIRNVSTLVILNFSSHGYTFRALFGYNMCGDYGYKYDQMVALGLEGMPENYPNTR